MIFCRSRICVAAIRAQFGEWWRRTSSLTPPVYYPPQPYYPATVLHGTAGVIILSQGIRRPALILDPVRLRRRPGLPRYSTGTPCRLGHMAERWTSDGKWRRRRELSDERLTLCRRSLAAKAVPSPGAGDLRGIKKYNVARGSRRNSSGGCKTASGRWCGSYKVLGVIICSMAAAMCSSPSACSTAPHEALASNELAAGTGTGQRPRVSKKLPEVIAGNAPDRRGQVGNPPFPASQTSERPDGSGVHQRLFSGAVMRLYLHAMAVIIFASLLQTGCDNRTPSPPDDPCSACLPTRLAG